MRKEKSISTVSPRRFTLASPLHCTSQAQHLREHQHWSLTEKIENGFEIRPQIKIKAESSPSPQRITSPECGATPSTQAVIT